MSWDEYRNNYIQKQDEADEWQGFHSRFMQLACEEQGRAHAITKGKVLGGMDQVLRASCNYSKHPEGHERGKPEQGLICLLDTPPHGVWNTGDGVSENFLERVRLCMARAGRALPDYPKGADAEDFWLHRLYLDLLKNNSECLFCGTKKGGMIVSVCVASATFCSRLERQALEQSEPGKQEIPSWQPIGRGTREATGGRPPIGQDENLRNAIPKETFSCVQNNEKTTRSPESAPTNAAADVKMRIVQNIEKLRKECGWSYNQLAKATGIDKKLVLSHVHGKHKPKPSTQREYAQAFTKRLSRSITANNLEA
jgi:ribosome-binding protein aMBF1 (putative translation factor)